MTALLSDKFRDEISYSLDQVVSYPDSDKKTVIKTHENTAFWIVVRWKIQVLYENLPIEVLSPKVFNHCI